MNKRHYEHTLPNIRGSLSNTYIEGTLSASLWKDKDGNHQIQLSIAADTLEFINTGKREGTASDTADTTDTAGEVPEPPADAPQDDKDDLPF